MLLLDLSVKIYQFSNTINVYQRLVVELSQPLSLNKIRIVYFAAINDSWCDMIQPHFINKTSKEDCDIVYSVSSLVYLQKENTKILKQLSTMRYPSSK